MTTEAEPLDEFLKRLIEFHRARQSDYEWLNPEYRETADLLQSMLDEL